MPVSLSSAIVVVSTAALLLVVVNVVSVGSGASFPKHSWHGQLPPVACQERSRSGSVCLRDCYEGRDATCAHAAIPRMCSLANASGRQLLAAESRWRLMNAVVCPGFGEVGSLESDVRSVGGGGWLCVLLVCVRSRFADVGG